MPLSLALLCQARSATAAPPATTPTTGYSATALYNVANAYARAGRPGMAVLNYERASLLDPADPDIAANLRFVRNNAKLPSHSGNAVERALRATSSSLLSWAALLGMVLVGSGLLAGRLSQGPTWLRRSAVLLGIALVSITVCQGVALWPLLHEAVVIADATPARVSPVPMGEPLFTLPEAETVTMQAEHEGFLLVKTHAGRTGWVSSTAIAAVVPKTPAH